MRTDLGSSQVDLLLLAILSGHPAHGYGVINLLRQRSGGAFDVPEGTVYPALHRLEASGLIASDRTTVDGRQRRIYSLTSSGRRALNHKREDWERTVKGVHAVLAVAR
jgi:PadR family transcriptional regulator, regulatory protein PadR